MFLSKTFKTIFEKICPWEADLDEAFGLVVLWLQRGAVSSLDLEWLQYSASSILKKGKPLNRKQWNTYFIQTHGFGEVTVSSVTWASSRCIVAWVTVSNCEYVSGWSCWIFQVWVEVYDPWYDLIPGWHSTVLLAVLAYIEICCKRQCLTDCWPLYGSPAEKEDWVRCNKFEVGSNSTHQFCQVLGSGGWHYYDRAHMQKWSGFFETWIAWPNNTCRNRLEQGKSLNQHSCWEMWEGKRWHLPLSVCPMAYSDAVTRSSTKYEDQQCLAKFLEFGFRLLNMFVSCRRRQKFVEQSVARSSKQWEWRTTEKPKETKRS